MEKIGFNLRTIVEDADSLLAPRAFEKGIDILKSEFDNKLKVLTEENVKLKTQQEVKDKEYLERLKTLEENVANSSFNSTTAFGTIP